MSFASRLLDWYDEEGRHDLPWQRDRTPYRIWVSEIMLQQTQVATVIPYFERFLAAFPRLVDLATALSDDVMALWAGLGYYSRARNLKRSAELCVERHGGELPMSYDQLVALPGIGRSTAGAILALATGARHAILDGNVKRVLARHHAVDGWPGRSPVLHRLWDLAEAATPSQRVDAYTQAIMDLGATVCTPRDPSCDRCPVAEDCAGRQTGDPQRYPERKPRRALPERHAFALLVAVDGGLLLERRPPTGLWGGLYATPILEDLHGVGAFAPTAAPIRHAFTHFRLTLTPVLLTAGPPAAVRDLDTRPVTAADAEALGMPKPVAELVNNYFEGALEWQERFIA